MQIKEGGLRIYFFCHVKWVVFDVEFTLAEVWKSFAFGKIPDS